MTVITQIMIQVKPNTTILQHEWKWIFLQKILIFRART